MSIKSYLERMENETTKAHHEDMAGFWAYLFV